MEKVQAKRSSAWTSYSLAIGLNDKAEEEAQVATLFSVIGEEAHEVFATFAWTTAGDESKVIKVLEKLEQYCNVPFERYR